MTLGTKDIYLLYHFPTFNKYLLLLCLLFSPLLTNANSIDSIKQVIQPRVEGYNTMELLSFAANYANGNLPMAIALSELAKDKALAENDLESLFNVCREQGFYYEDNNKLYEAKSAYENALKYANKSENNKLLQTIYTDLAIINRKMSNYKATKDYHILSLELGEKEENQEMIEYAYHGLGFLYETVGDYEKAIEYYLKSVSIAEARGYISGTITTLQNIGLTYIKLNDKERALESIEKAYLLATEQQDTLQIANVLNDHVEILVTSGDYEAALQKFRASLSVYELANYKPTIARSLINIAEVYVKQDKYELAHRYFLKSLEYDKYIRDEDYANLYNKLGILYFRQNEIEKSKEAFQRSLDISINNNYKKLSQNNHQHLYQIHKQQNNHQVALIHLESTNNLKDSLLNIDKAQRIAEMQFKYDIAHGEREIHALRLRQNNILLVGSLTLFTFLVSVLIYILKLRGRNNRSLKFKNAEIEAQNIKLRESNEVHKQFAYVAAHDLKEPLRNIGSFVNLLDRRYGKQFNEEAREYMAFVTGGVKRLNNLLADLLSYSQISSEIARKELVSVGSVLREVQINLQNTITSKQAVINYPQQLPVIHMSKVHLLQLMQNIISNGLKFVEDKKPIIDITCTPADDHILFSIKDNGIGINKEYEEKVFNLFHRLNKNSHYDGTGIGLTICKNIVDKYDGKIWLESEPGQGTTFFIYLPVKTNKHNEPASSMQHATTLN